MKLMFVKVGALALLSVAAGCALKPPQAPDGGGSGGIGSVDAGQDAPTTTRSDVGIRVAIDAPAPFTGVRSFVVTSVLQRDGGAGSFPASHVFTLVVDADRRTAITGDAGEGTVSTFQVLESGWLYVVGPLRFATGACAGSEIMYDDLQFGIDAGGGLTGVGHGMVSMVSGDVAYSAPTAMSLTGVVDTQPPTLSVIGSPSDPFVQFAAVASEPLPPGGTATLQGPGSETYVMGSNDVGNPFMTTFYKPAVMLRYATQYFVTSTGIADFAGNASIPTSNPSFTTRALPPLAAEDGFESVTTPTFGGVQVLSGAGAPTLTGARSLYIPPTAIGATTLQPQFLVRLALADGDTVVRFTYRAVQPATASTGTVFPYGATWYLGSEGGTFAGLALPTDNTGATTTATIGGTQVVLGPLLTATFTLPPDAVHEVALQRTPESYTGCGAPPMPAISGLIIDDLRAE